MQDADLPLGHHNGPREFWPSKVQVMGGPAQGWNLTFEANQIVGFLAERLPNVRWKEPEVAEGETNMAIAYDFPPEFIIPDGSGLFRLNPAPSMFFDQLPYGITYDLLEMLVPQGNTEIVVAFDEFRSQFFVPGSNRNDGIFRLTEAVHSELSALMYPNAWGQDE